MMSTRTNRKQQSQKEHEDEQQLAAPEEREAEAALTEVEGQETEREEERQPLPEKEEPRRVRRPRRRVRPLAPEEDDLENFAPYENRRASSEQEERLSIPDVLPVLPLKDTVVYPFAVQPLGVGQERSIRLIDDVMRGNRLVVLVAQKSAEIEQAGPYDIFSMGTVARIARMIRMPDGTIQIIVQGLERVVIGEFTQIKPYLMAQVTVKPDIQEEDNETEAIKRNVVNYFQRLVALVQN